MSGLGRFFGSLLQGAGRGLEQQATHDATRDRERDREKMQLLRQQAMARLEEGATERRDERLHSNRIEEIDAQGGVRSALQTNRQEFQRSERDRQYTHEERMFRIRRAAENTDARALIRFRAEIGREFGSDADYDLVEGGDGYYWAFNGDDYVRSPIRAPERRSSRDDDDDSDPYAPGSTTRAPRGSVVGDILTRVEGFAPPASTAGSISDDSSTARYTAPVRVNSIAEARELAPGTQFIFRGQSYTRNPE